MESRGASSLLCTREVCLRVVAGREEGEIRIKFKFCFESFVLSLIKTVVAGVYSASLIIFTVVSLPYRPSHVSHSLLQLLIVAIL